MGATLMVVHYTFIRHLFWAEIRFTAAASPDRSGYPAEASAAPACGGVIANGGKPMPV